MKNCIQKILVYKEIVQTFEKSTKKLNRGIPLQTDILQKPTTFLLVHLNVEKCKIILLIKI